LPTVTPTTFLIYYVPNTGGGSFYPSLKRTNGTNTVIENIGGTVIAFAPSRPSIFQVIVGPGDSINLKMDVGKGNAAVGTLIVLEVETAAASYLGIPPTQTS